MQESNYIVDRYLPDIMRQICDKKDIAVRLLSDEWVLVLKKAEKTHFIYGFKFGGLNDSAAATISQDKVATYELLREANVPAVPHVLVSTRANSYKGWLPRANEWEQFVIKPTHGGGGRAVYLLSNTREATKLMNGHGEQSWCVAPFVKVLSETRLIFLGEEIVLAFEKHDPPMGHGLPMHNLRLGARAVVVEPAAKLVSLARAARKALGLRLGAVDIVELETGETLVLEVNEGFSLEHFMRQSAEYKQLAEGVYEKIVEAMVSLD